MLAAERTILSIGEAKTGERLTRRHLDELEEARAALGDRAAKAKLLLFGTAFAPALAAAASGRRDVELIDLDRLYTGS